MAVGWEIGLSPLIHFIPITWNHTRYGLIQADARAISGNLAASPAPLSNSSHLLACLVVLFFFLSPNCFPKQCGEQAFADCSFFPARSIRFTRSSRRACLDKCLMSEKLIDWHPLFFFFFFPCINVENFEEMSRKILIF